MDKPKQLKDLVREKNIRIHDKEASVYEIIHPQLFNWYHKKKSWKDIKYIFSMLSSKQKIEVLDLGCGTGFLTLKVIEFSHTHVTGVDLSKEMLSKLEDKVVLSYKDRLSLINHEALNFMHNNHNRYDLIMASAFLHHLVDMREFINLTSKNLKSGGILYIANEPLKQAIDSRIRFIFHRWIRALDIFIFNFYMRLSKIKIDVNHEKTIADYQTRLGGIDPLELISYLKDKGTIIKFNKFAVRANGFLAFISDKIVRSQNTFSIISIKP